MALMFLSVIGRSILRYAAARHQLFFDGLDCLLSRHAIRYRRYYEIVVVGISISVVFSFILSLRFPLMHPSARLQWQFTDIEILLAHGRGVLAKNVLGQRNDRRSIRRALHSDGIKLRSFWKSLWHVFVLCGCVTLIIFARSGHRIGS